MTIPGSERRGGEGHAGVAGEGLVDDPRGRDHGRIVRDPADGAAFGAESRQGQVLGHAGGRVARGITDRKGSFVGGNHLGWGKGGCSGRGSTTTTDQGREAQQASQTANRHRSHRRFSKESECGCVAGERAATGERSPGLGGTLGTVGRAPLLGCPAAGVGPIGPRTNAAAERTMWGLRR